MNQTSQTGSVSFVAGVVQSAEVVRVVGQVWSPDEKFVETWLLKWTASTGQWSRFPVPRLMTQIDVLLGSSPFAIASGPDGSTAVLSPQGNVFEVIAPNGKPANQIGPIRKLRVIGGAVFACGMGRQVLRRTSAGWIRIDQGAIARADDLTVSGFNSIDGVDESNLVAVGFGGEIWTCANRAWVQENSPTNAVLNDVACVANNLGYSCGKGGLLLKKTEAAWQQVEHTAGTEEFWSLAHFKGELYVSSTHAIYKLIEGKYLERVSPVGSRSFGILDASEEAMVAVGLSNVFRTVDGVHWDNITPPT